VIDLFSQFYPEEVNIGDYLLNEHGDTIQSQTVSEVDVNSSTQMIKLPGMYCHNTILNQLYLQQIRYQSQKTNYTSECDY
jgi:hypothetical protein